MNIVLTRTVYLQTNKNMKIRYLLLLLIITSLFSACKKNEGFGGTSIIKGTVIQQNFNELGELVDSYEAPDERVYIIFGEDEIYGDDVNTHYNGKYAFTGLRKGSYRLFAYSECRLDSCSAPNVPAIIEIEIKENNQTVNAQDIIINNF